MAFILGNDISLIVNRYLHRWGIKKVHDEISKLYDWDETNLCYHIRGKLVRREVLAFQSRCYNEGKWEFVIGSNVPTNVYTVCRNGNLDWRGYTSNILPKNY